MPRYFYAFMSTGSSPGLYDLYYNSFTSGSLLQLYFEPGFAEDLTYSEVATGYGVGVIIPDAASSVVVVNKVGGLNLQQVIAIPTPTPTPLPPTATPLPPTATPLPPTATPTPTPLPQYQVELCGGGEGPYIVSLASGDSPSGIGQSYKLSKDGTPFDGIKCWVILENPGVGTPDYEAVAFGTVYSNCLECNPPAPTATPLPATATPLPPTATPLPPTATPLPPTATPLPCECWTVVNEDTVTITYRITSCDGVVSEPNLTANNRRTHCIQGGSIIQVLSPVGGLLGEYDCGVTCTQTGGECTDCGPATPTPTPTPLPPTATPLPPTATPLPPTATPLPPTATPLPPTATPLPATATPLPPTATPLPPTATPQPTINVQIHTSQPSGYLACNGGTTIAVQLSGTTFCNTQTFTSSYFTGLGTNTFWLSYAGEYRQIFHSSGQNTAVQSGACQACNSTAPTATPLPPTATPLPPTATPLPPTATPLPPTATPTNPPLPPTATPGPTSYEYLIGSSYNDPTSACDAYPFDFATYVYATSDNPSSATQFFTDPGLTNPFFGADLWFAYARSNDTGNVWTAIVSASGFTSNRTLCGFGT